MAFTERQRKHILNRDGNKCQFPMDDNKGGIKKCGLTNNLHVHHIFPQRMAEVEGLDQDNEVDIEENGITLGELHHNGDIHPDMADAKVDYGRQKQVGVEKPTSFQDTFKKRDELAQKGVPYWNTDYDEYFIEVARENSDASVQVFPPKKRRTTKNRKARKWYAGLFED